MEFAEAFDDALPIDDITEKWVFSIKMLSHSYFKDAIDRCIG